MAEHACIPDMGYAHSADTAQHTVIEEIHLAAAVLLQRTVKLAGKIRISEKTCKNLVN